MLRVCGSLILSNRRKDRIEVKITPVLPGDVFDSCRTVTFPKTDDDVKTGKSFLVHQGDVVNVTEL